MHAKAAAEIDRDVVKAPLIDEIGRAKELDPWRIDKRSADPHPAIQAEGRGG